MRSTRYVDADACPVVRIVEKLAQKYSISCTLLCDTNHVLNSDYSEIIIVGAGADAVDFKLVSLLQRGDICVSQDYGVAAMALGKGSYAIHLRSNSPLTVCLHTKAKVASGIQMRILIRC